jgi:hypothetical protein
MGLCVYLLVNRYIRIIQYRISQILRCRREAPPKCSIFLSGDRVTLIDCLKQEGCTGEATSIHFLHTIINTNRSVGYAKAMFN